MTALQRSALLGTPCSCNAPCLEVTRWRYASSAVKVSLVALTASASENSVATTLSESTENLSTLKLDSANRFSARAEATAPAAAAAGEVERDRETR